MTFKIQLFTGALSELPLGACWQAEDIDGNKGMVYLKSIEGGHNVYRWSFTYWNGEKHEGNESNLRIAYRKFSVHFTPGRDGLIPDLQRVANYYTGRKEVK